MVFWSEILCLFLLRFLVSQVHENKGVKFITDAAVKEFKGENGKVGNVEYRIAKLMSSYISPVLFSSS